MLRRILYMTIEKNPYHRVNFALHHAIGFIYPVTVSYITSINYIKLLSNNNLFSRDLLTTVLHSFGNPKGKQSSYFVHGNQVRV